MKVAFVGGGHVFGYHAWEFKRSIPNSQFYIIDPDDRIAKISGLDRLTLDEATNIVDLAIIMTPSHVRWKVCKPFIDKKIPIIVEKPLTIKWEEIDLFEQAAKHSWICPIANARALPLIDNFHKEAQNIKLIECWKIRSLSKEYYTGWHGKYTTDGGVLAQQGFHCLDLVCWFGGKPISVQAIGEKSGVMECEDTARVEIEFENGCKGIINCSTNADRTSNAGIQITTDTKIYKTDGFQFVRDGTLGHTIIALNSVEALKLGKEPPITVESMIPSLRTLHACYTSMDQNGAKTMIGKPHDKLGTYE